ncbi:bifunctional adenosylcobinamide kinase/adenosylcobinamide-phosphate guanylyltransferase [Jatrophihabitans sp.]|uniref:bifunctional adenosylcobinamide kinase/adenosylcobinamide-phosphate guanylyltransferase n=1 Tax=Jatrophihabitans sp. TaxID=1932789 RepID=UPI002BEC3351|nr:bifunctional adenosylcobinamide kinase/adenosylcobinamide-phosphate guanylyltransferase [Jatrophihabitans sp.]
MARQRTLVLGGVRSGKSSWAERQLAGHDRVDYLATAAERDDADWARRIAEHRRRRPAHWRTVQTLELAGALAAPGAPLLIEDLGNWLARTIDRTGGWDGDLSAFRTQADQLVDAWQHSRARVVLVSNEVGSGVHPETRAGRIFADELGRLNTALASHADEVVLVVAGLPLWLRGPVTGQPEPEPRQSGERQ